MKNISGRKKYLSLILLFLFLIFSFLINLGSVPIRIWDEARLANNALYMYLHNNWLVTYYEGQPDMWNTKPPLLIWLQVIFMKMFGINEWSIRLPSALASIAAGLLLWKFFQKYFNKPWIGFLAGCVFASTFAYVYIHGGRFAEYDALLILFITLYSLCFFLFLWKENLYFLIGFFLFLILATLTKSIAGLLLLPGIVLYTIVQKKLKLLFTSKRFYLGILSFILIVGSFYIIRENMNNGFLKAVYGNELGGRYLSTLEEHRHPFNYYWNNMKVWRYSYWIWFVIPAFVIGYFVPDKILKQLSLFNFLLTSTYFLIISTAGTKLEWYDLPLYPFFAIQIAIFLFYIFYFLRERMKLHNSAPVVGSFLFLIVFFIPFKHVYNQVYEFQEQPWDIEPHKHGYYLKHSIENNKNLNNHIFIYDGYNGQIAFYIKKLQHQNVDVSLKNSVENLKPGQHVVVSQEEMQQKLLQHYAVKKEEDIFGCSVYRIVTKL